jgi:hypothetical protein
VNRIEANKKILHKNWLLVDAEQAGQKDISEPYKCSKYTIGG